MLVSEKKAGYGVDADGHVVIAYKKKRRYYN
jgi:hypothetical protein